MRRRLRMRVFARRSAGTAAALLPFPALGASPASTVPFDSGGLAGGVASLVIVVLVIIVLGWIYARSQRLNPQGGGVFNIVASQALGARERLLVIEVAGRQILVAMTPSQISTLYVFDDKAVVPAGPPAAGEHAFAARLLQAIRGKK